MLDIRPSSLSEYQNQESVKASLSVAIEAAQMRSMVLDHALFYGPPGLGKTTLAGAIAHDMHGALVVTSGPVLEKAQELIAILMRLTTGAVLFIDEIHRMPHEVEEALYSAMEDREVDTVIGNGAAARAVRVKLPPFTLIGATTKFGAISPPLRDRFGHVHRLEYYTPDVLARIVSRTAALTRTRIDDSACYEIADRARGTPRIANRLFARARDHALVRGDGNVTGHDALEAMHALDIDPLGLDKLDRDVLTSIAKRFSGGPVGLATLAASVNEDIHTLSDVVEPYLSTLGFITRTPRGRCITPKGYAHIEREGSS